MWKEDILNLDHKPSFGEKLAKNNKMAIYLIAM